MENGKLNCNWQHGVLDSLIKVMPRILKVCQVNVFRVTFQMTLAVCNYVNATEDSIIDSIKS